MLPIFFLADSSSHEEKSHTVVSTETRDVVTSAGGRDDDSDVEIDLESVEEGDQLNSSDDKTEGKNSTKKKLYEIVSFYKCRFSGGYTQILSYAKELI